MPWPKGGGSDKIRLDDGKIHRLVLLEDECSEIYNVHYVNGKNVGCEPPDCQHCRNGNKRQERGVIRVYDTEDAKEKKLTMTPTLSFDVQKALEVCGGRKGFVFNMVGEKVGGKMKYSVVPMPAVSPAAEKPAKEEEAPF